MMTALLVVDRATPDAKVRVTKEALAYKGSAVGVLPKGKRIKLETMLNGLLLPSGNDAAIALAQRTSGTVAAFVERMNERAGDLGLACTRFSSPDGFEDAGNHSCAIDLAEMASALLDRPRLARIVKRRRAVLPFPIKGGRYISSTTTRCCAPAIRARSGSRRATPTPRDAAWSPPRGATGAGWAWCSCTPPTRAGRPRSCSIAASRPSRDRTGHAFTPSGFLPGHRRWRAEWVARVHQTPERGPNMPDKKTKRPLAKFALIGGLLVAAGDHLHHHGRGKSGGHSGRCCLARGR